MKKRIFISILVLFSLVAFFSCKSVQTTIPEDATEAQLTKLAQNAYDNGNTKAARFYYEAIIEKYGDNPESFVSAKFELAHLLVKEKKFKEAEPILEEILGLYNSEYSKTLAPEYKKLAEIDLAKIQEKENQ